MMMSPETYYRNYLKGKGKAEILEAISELEQEIRELKEIIAAPDYEPLMVPSESVQLSCTEDYLKRAKEELAKLK